MRCKIITILGILCILLSCLLPFSGSGTNEVTRTRPGMALLVDHTLPENGATTVPIDTDVKITFNMAINITLFPKGFQMYPSITGTFTWSNENKTASFTPNEDLADYAQYQLTIDRNYVQSDDGAFTLEDNYTWSFTTGHFHPFELILGPFLTEENKFVESAKVTITINGVEYKSLTDAMGIARFEFPEQPSEGEYEILVLKKGFENYNYIIEINSAGTYDPIPPESLKKEKENPPSFIPGFEILIFLSGLLLIIYTKKRK